MTPKRAKSPGTAPIPVQERRNGALAGIDVGQRNTPALFGASVIDAIPDEAILANERNQRLKSGLFDINGDIVPAGRAARVGHNRVGKFGWKANIGNLSEFVRVACANELGLGNPFQAQPVSLSKPDYRPRGLDLTDQQCDQMTAFIASLPRPQEVTPAAPAEAARASAGKKHFKQIGCANCHLPDLAEAQGIYSDLLLHEMGDELGGGGSYGSTAGVIRPAGLRRRLDVSHQMAHAAAVGGCRFRTLSPRRPGIDAGRGHQAARRPGGAVCDSLRGALGCPARRADCILEHAAIPERFALDAWECEGLNIKSIGPHSAFGIVFPLVRTPRMMSCRPDSRARIGRVDGK